MHLPSYRGCWHGISRCFLLRYPQKFVPSEQKFTPRKGVILHAVSLRQAFAHCGRFLTAASRRSMGRVSVPSVGVRLSPPLNVIALVSHYLTNKLILRRPLRKRKTLLLRDYRELFWISPGYARLPGTFLRVTTSSAMGLNPFDLHALSIPPAFTLS